MNHDQKRIELIKYLINENPQYCGMKIPEDTDSQKRLLRSLMNVRLPRPVDEYLSEEVELKGVTDSDDLPAAPLDDRLVLWRGDITTLKIDAIVNVANSALRGCFVPCHSCVDNIIHSVSGIELRLKCDEIMNRQGHEEPTGQAKITPAYNRRANLWFIQLVPLCRGYLLKSIVESWRTVTGRALRWQRKMVRRALHFAVYQQANFIFRIKGRQRSRSVQYSMCWRQRSV